ncbi:MAG: hypothetical protein ACRCYP_01155, partial [Alphaproteobacteria bacterium]
MTVKVWRGYIRAVPKVKIMKKILLLGFCAGLISLTACTDVDKAVVTLENQGYTQIETTGYKFGACS